MKHTLHILLFLALAWLYNSSVRAGVYTYTFKATDFPQEVTKTSSGSFTKDNIQWNYNLTNRASTGSFTFKNTKIYDLEHNDYAVMSISIQNKARPVFVFSTSSLSGTITSVKLWGSQGSARNMEVVLSVGNNTSQTQTFIDNYGSLTFTPNAAGSLTITIQPKSTQAANTVYLQRIEIETDGTEQVPITEKVHLSPIGYTSFASRNALNFTGTAVKAHVAQVENGAIKLVTVNRVPANTGLILTGTANAEADIPIITSEETEPIPNNQLTAAATDQTVNNVWVLSQKNGVTGFFKYTGTTITAGHAYLQATTDMVQGKNYLTITYNGTTDITAIPGQESKNKDVLYDLQGRRVNEYYKGWVILNKKLMYKP